MMGEVQGFPLPHLIPHNKELGWVVDLQLENLKSLVVFCNSYSGGVTE